MSFKSGDFDVEDEERPDQTQEELIELLGVIQSTISARLKASRFENDPKVGYWVPYELNPIDVERQKRKGFFAPHCYWR